MRGSGSKVRAGLWSRRIGLGLAACLALITVDRGHDATAPGRTKAELGRMLFLHKWTPNDKLAHGGDGLGPAFNDVSCVACHNEGGAGGAGTPDKNVDLLTMSREGIALLSPIHLIPSPLVESIGPAIEPAPDRPTPDPFPTMLPAVSGFLDGLARTREEGRLLVELFELHPSFRDSTAVTLHRFGAEPEYRPWREARFPSDLARHLTDGIRRGRRPDFFLPPPSSVPFHADRTRAIEGTTAPTTTQFVGTLTVTRSQRNPTPLFGLGLVDAIPDAAIEAEASHQADTTPATAGRVGRDEGGRIGRLGWKGQTASVEDFVLNACAVEVGLEVPGHPQGTLPIGDRAGAKGLDLTRDECKALVAFVRGLPRPVEVCGTGQHAANIAAGRASFAAIGCAHCHTPDLGPVAGLYSDLLLHDMGDAMATSGSYGGSGGDDEETTSSTLAATGPGPVERGPRPRSTPGASRREWRTPPLWGVRDSAPYLHDGRARTLEQAIALHAGQGEASARRFFDLPAEGRIRVQAFLKSLVAPSPGEPVAMRQGARNRPPSRRARRGRAADDSTSTRFGFDQ